MKKWLGLFVFTLLILSTVFSLKPLQAHAASNSNMIDDIVFDNKNSTTPSQIDSWLNANFPSSCISTNSGFTAPDPTGYFPDANFIDGHYTYGAPVSAGTVIYDAAVGHSINPQVLITKLQNEEGLVVGNGTYGCGATAMAAAVGYACTDSGTFSHSYTYTGANPYTDSSALVTPLYYRNGSPVNSVSGNCVAQNVKAGFSEQVVHAAWLLSFSRHKSEGQTSWAAVNGSWNHCEDNASCAPSFNIPAGWACYSGLMTQGYFKRCPTDSSTIYYDGYATIDNTSTHIDTGATAALYVYTPHFQSFDNIFTPWFGSPYFSANSISMTSFTQPNLSPALGETVSYTVSFKNNTPDSLTLDAIGIVGRLNNFTTGANRDFGWQGPITLAPSGQSSDTWQYTFATTIKDLGTIYAWPAVNYKGTYFQYNNWSATLNTHIPNIGATLSPSQSPVTGQTDNFSVVIRNFESHTINLDAAGIPIRFYGAYNYDTGWTSPVSVAPSGGTATISGSVTYDKPGPFTEWVSALIGGRYITISPIYSVNVSAPSLNTSNLQIVSYSATPNPNPALGEDAIISYTLKNTLPVPITLDAAGVVSRYDNPYTGPDRYFDWQSGSTIAAGGTKTFSGFASNISDLRTTYAWPAVSYQGKYIQYNAWGFQMTPHLPNLVLSAPLTVNNGSPTYGTSNTVRVTITNNEPHPIRYSATGIPIRFFGTYNYDAVWQGPGTLAANGQSGDSVALTGSVTFDKHGPYAVWASILIQGRYITIGTTQSINL